MPQEGEWQPLLVRQDASGSITNMVCTNDGVMRSYTYNTYGNTASRRFRQQFRLHRRSDRYGQVMEASVSIAAWFLLVFTKV